MYFSRLQDARAMMLIITNTQNGEVQMKSQEVGQRHANLIFPFEFLLLLKLR